MNNQKYSYNAVTEGRDAWAARAKVKGRGASALVAWVIVALVVMPSAVIAASPEVRLPSYDWVCPPGNEAYYWFNNTSSYIGCRKPQDVFVPGCDTWNGSDEGNGFGSGSGGRPERSGGGSSCVVKNGVCGMPAWSVVEPLLNVFIKDTPFYYVPSRGPNIEFGLSYKNFQGHTIANDTTWDHVFSVGKRWHTPWRSYLAPKKASGGEPNGFYLIAGDGSARLYTLNVPDPDTQATLSLVGSDYLLTFKDGSIDYYAESVNGLGGGEIAIFISRREDPQGRAYETYQYSYPAGQETLILNKIIDIDANEITFTYTNVPPYENLISKINGPFGLEARLSYNASGELIWMRDAVEMESSLSYDSSNRVSQLVTPYGTTSFKYYFPSGTDAWMGLRVTEFGNRQHLYVLGNLTIDPWTGAEGEYDSLIAKIGNHLGSFSLPQTWDDPIVSSVSTFKNRNTCYWGPRQYGNLPSGIKTALDGTTFNALTLTTNQFNLGHMRHWLKRHGMNIGFSISAEKPPGSKTDGSESGPITWYDYNKITAVEYEGTLPMPKYVAKRVHKHATDPTMDEWYIRMDERDPQGRTTTWVETFGPIGSMMLRSGVNVYSSGNLTEVYETSELGVTKFITKHAYNGAHQRTDTWDDPTGFNYHTTFEYSPTTGQLTKTTRPSGWITENTYDATSKRLLSAVDKTATINFRTNAYTFSNGQIATHTDPRGLVTSYTYDKLWRVTELRSDNSGITNVYEKLDIMRTTNRMGFAVNRQRNALGQPTRVTNELGKVTVYQYCDCGSLESTTDPLGKVTSYTYDNAGRRIRTTFPGGSWTENTYSRWGQVTNILDSAGVSVTNSYTIDGLVYRVDTAFGRRSFVAYDYRNLPTTVIDANGVTETRVYDVLRRLSSRSLPGGQLEQFTYSSSGMTQSSKKLTTTDNAITTFTLDAMGRKIQETSPINGVVKYTFSHGGDLLGLTNELSYVTYWVYDAYGRMKQKYDATSTQILTNDYNANHWLTRRWSKEKGLTLYSYNNAGDLSLVDYPSGTADISMTYDDNRRLTQMVDASGTSTYGYTDWGALQSEDGPWPNDTVTVGYGANRLRSSLTVTQPNSPAWAQSYIYDSAARLTNVTSPAGLFHYVHHVGLLSGVESPAQVVQQLILPSTAKIDYTYDSSSRMLSSKLKTSANAVMNAHEYAYDYGDRVTRQTRTQGDFVDYAYDKSGQLLNAAGKEVGGTTVRTNEQFGYFYDAAGNLNRRTNGLNTTANTLVQSLTADSRNQLTGGTISGTFTVAGIYVGNPSTLTVKDNSNAARDAVKYSDGSFARSGVPRVNGNNTFIVNATDASSRSASQTLTVNLPDTVTFSYDQNGNMTSDGLRAFTYDAENQLISVSVANTWKSEFTYDGMLRLRLRKEFTWTGSWVLTNEVRYVYDGKLVVQERNGLNIPIVQYTRGYDIGKGLEAAGGIGGLLARSDLLLGVHHYYHGDRLGNITALSDAAQRVAGKYLYDPFGNQLGCSGTAAEANTYRFSSKEWHANSGLCYYGYRFYDPNLQRWPNRDPIYENGGINLYSFVNNRPTQKFDPFGLKDNYSPKPKPIIKPPTAKPPTAKPPTAITESCPKGGGNVAGTAAGLALGVYIEVLQLNAIPDVGPEPLPMPCKDAKKQCRIKFVTVKCELKNIEWQDDEGPGICNYHCTGPGIDYSFSVKSDDCSTFTYLAPVIVP